MSDPFESLLEILGDNDQPIPMHRLTEFSDPNRSDLENLRDMWGEIPTKRRRAVVAELGQLALDHFEFLFEPVNRYAMNDPDPQVRCMAIENLWESEDPDLVLPLLSALRGDRSADVRAAAAKILGKFVYMAELEELAMGLRTQLEETLINAVQNDSVQSVRRRSLESLGYSSRREVPALIKQAYSGSEIDDLLTAITAMGRSADDTWGPDVLGHLHHSGPVIRAAAARAAGELELRESIPELIELLEDVHQEVRRQAIWALGQLGGDEAQQALAAMEALDLDEQTKDIIRDALDHLIFLQNTDGILRETFGYGEDPLD